MLWISSNGPMFPFPADAHPKVPCKTSMEESCLSDEVMPKVEKGSYNQALDIRDSEQVGVHPRVGGEPNAGMPKQAMVRVMLYGPNGLWKSTASISAQR